MFTNQLSKVVLMFLFVGVVGCTRADEAIKPPSTGPSESEAEQIKRITERLDQFAPAMLNQISFTMLHCAGTESIDAFMKAVGSPDAHGKGFKFESAVREAGGLEKYRRRVAKLLSDDNIILRGYGAQWLGIVGDETCMEDLARLLKRKSASKEVDVLDGFDREQAAAALGMLGAKKYAKDIAALLQDPNGRVRAGAATALALMKATDYADSIAQLLGQKSSAEDPNGERAGQAAIIALTKLDAKQHAQAIAKQLKDYGDGANFAMYALVALNAKEQAKNIAVLLKDKFRGGNAALALSLMGATEYTADIAELLKDKDDLGSNRCKAVFALGVLQAKQYIPDIAELMKDSKGSKQVVAAWALVMLEAKEYAPEAIKIIKKHKREDCRYLWMPEQGEVLAVEQFYEAEERARKSLKKLGELGEIEAQPAPKTE